MKHYTQSLTIEATPAEVYAALTTPEGLRGWWTEECDVDTRVGGEHRFRFGPHYKHMRIDTLDPQREVRWHCTAARIDIDRFTRKDEWMGTDLLFRLAPAPGGHTRLDFEHIGLVPGFECYDLCSNGWQHCLASLAQYAATGQGSPHGCAGECSASAATAAQAA